MAKVSHIVVCQQDAKALPTKASDDFLKDLNSYRVNTCKGLSSKIYSGDPAALALFPHAFAHSPESVTHLLTHMADGKLLKNLSILVSRLLEIPISSNTARMFSSTVSFRKIEGS